MKINMKKEQTLAVDVSRVHKPTYTQNTHTHNTQLYLPNRKRKQAKEKRLYKDIRARIPH